jgi:hypothetical protein
MKILWLILVTQILSLPSIANSQNSLPLQASLIQKNQPASYDGVLLPIETLRQLQTDHLNMQLYKDELAKHEGEVPLYITPDSSKFVIVGVVALILGYVIGMTVH